MQSTQVVLVSTNNFSPFRSAKRMPSFEGILFITLLLNISQHYDIIKQRGDNYKTQKHKKNCIIRIISCNRYGITAINKSNQGNRRHVTPDAQSRAPVRSDLRRSIRYGCRNYPSLSSQCYLWYASDISQCGLDGT